MKTKIIISGIGLLTLGGIGGNVVVQQIDAQIDPYTPVTVVEGGKQVQKLEITGDSSLPEGGKVQDIVSTDQPKITLSKWNGEVALGIKSLDLPPDTTGSRPLFSKNVEWTSGNVKMQVVPLDATTTMEDGGMEINIILNSAPTSNVFTFQLENWENLDFFYQPPLWQEAGLKAPTPDCTDTDCNLPDGPGNRPKNVVGSYAVYYKNHANHKEGSTNYATGKAYHIYRPLVTDNSGNTTWADLNYSNGVLSVTVPQVFLDGASYPVKIDPDFGYTTIGASSNGVTSNQEASEGTAYSPGQSGTGISMSAHIFITAGGNVNGQLGLYLNSNNSLVGNTGSFTITSTQQWVTTSFISNPILSNVNYITAVNTDGGSTSMHNDQTGSLNREHQVSTFGTWTDPATWTADGTARRYSLYVTYTVSAKNNSIIINGSNSGNSASVRINGSNSGKVVNTLFK